MEHNIKIREEYAELIQSGVKPWELRKHDRDYKVGDYLLFLIIDNSTEEFTGFTFRRRILYIYKGGGYGLKKGYSILTTTANPYLKIGN